MRDFSHEEKNVNKIIQKIQQNGNTKIQQLNKNDKIVFNNK